MTDNYTKTFEELSEYNHEGNLYLGKNTKTNEDSKIPLSTNKNIAITAPARYGKTNLLNSLLLQLTTPLNAIRSLYMIAEKEEDYRYFNFKGATVTSNIDYFEQVIDKAFEDAKYGNKTILVIENLDNVLLATQSRIASNLTKLIIDPNVTVITVDYRPHTLKNLFNIKLDLDKKRFCNGERGVFLVKDVYSEPHEDKYAKAIKTPFTAELVGKEAHEMSKEYHSNYK